MSSTELPTSSPGTLWSRRPRDGATRQWVIRPADVLWLGRMLVAEDGYKGRTETDAQAYTRGRIMVSMILRRLAVQMFAGPYTSVEHLLRGDPSGGQPRGWSQPLRWYGLIHDSEPLRARYRVAQARTWEQIPDYYRRAILDTVSGRVPLVAPHVVDAAAPEFTRARIEGEPGRSEGWRRELPGATRSWLVSTRLSRSWPESNVRIVSSAEGAAPLLAAAVVLALVLWSLYR